ncbi:MAG: glycoside hydrolase family 36 protein, partial [Candidatus Omnitrophota bacterium]
NSSGGISAIYDPNNQATFLISFLTWKMTSSNVTWIYRDSGHLYGWAGCNFAGYCLKPGERISSEKLFLGIYSSPFTGLEEYAEKSADMMEVNLPDYPPMGWCSWYAYGDMGQSEKVTLANAGAIRDKFPGYKFPYIQVDYGWTAGNLCGNWLNTNERFPHGIEWLAVRLKEMGFNLGLWVAIFTVLESSSVFQEHPEYMVKDRQGNPKTLPCRWYWPPHDRIYYLDPTHPGAQEFIRRTLTALRRAGVRYWKIDFTWGIADNDGDTVFYDQRYIKGAQVYRQGLAVVTDTLKDDYIYWCSNPVNLGFGTSPTSMSACDIARTGFSIVKQDENKTQGLRSFREIATTVISRYFLHKRLIMLNPDVVEVAGPGDIEEAKIRLSLVALSGGQVFLGDDLTALSDEQWRLLGKCIPPYGSAARPIDLFEHTYPDSYPHIWHLPVKTDWGSWNIVGLFNLNTEPMDIEVHFRSLGLQEEKDYLVFEFWDAEFIGKKKGMLKLNLQPLTTRLLLIKAVPDYPAVLSSDMHFTQGGVELSGVSYDVQTRMLQGRAIRQKGETGRLFVFVPEGYQVRDSGKVEGAGGLLVYPINFRDNVVDWHICF